MINGQKVRDPRHGLRRSDVNAQLLRNALSPFSDFMEISLGGQCRKEQANARWMMRGKYCGECFLNLYESWANFNENFTDYLVVGKQPSLDVWFILRQRHFSKVCMHNGNGTRQYREVNYRDGKYKHPPGYLTPLVRFTPMFCCIKGSAMKRRKRSTAYVETVLLVTQQSARRRTLLLPVVLRG